MNTAERVIFRVECPDTQSYLAVFPDTPANPGRVACVPFHFLGDMAVFEPFCEASMGYYYGMRIVHKSTDTALRCLKAIERYYNAPFRVVEKLTH